MSCSSSCESVFVIVFLEGEWQEKSNGAIEYVRSKVRNIGLKVPVFGSICELYGLVREKSREPNSTFTLSFKHPEFGYVMEMMDQSDYDHFINIARESRQGVINLYHVRNECSKEQLQMVEFKDPVRRESGKTPSSGKGSNNLLNIDTTVPEIEYKVFKKKKHGLKEQGDGEDGEHVDIKHLLDDTNIVGHGEPVTSFEFEEDVSDEDQATDENDSDEINVNADEDDSDEDHANPDVNTGFGICLQLQCCLIQLKANREKLLMVLRRI